MGLARIRVGVKSHPHSVQSSPAPLARGQGWGQSLPPCQFSTIKHLKNHVGFDVCFYCILQLKQDIITRTSLRTLLERHQMCETLLKNEPLELFCFASRWIFRVFSLQDFWWTHYSFQAGQSLGDRCYSLSPTAPLLVLRPTLSPGRPITEWSVLQPFPNNV